MSAYEDLRREILGLKGAILGAKVALFRGGQVTHDALEILQAIAIRIHDIADRLQKAHKKEIFNMNERKYKIEKNRLVKKSDCLREIADFLDALNKKESK